MLLRGSPTRHAPTRRPRSSVALATVLPLVLLLVQAACPAHAAVTYFVTKNVAVVPTTGSMRSQLTAACTAERSDSAPATFSPTDEPAVLLYPAMNAAKVMQVYVAAMYETVDLGSLWLWNSNPTVVTSQLWAPGYPAGDQLTLKYAVYDSNQGGLVNVDGNTPLAVGCSYGTPDDVTPPLQPPAEKKGFPWWAILIIVLVVVVIAVVVVVVVCCCCCRKKKSYDDADTEALDEDEQRLEQRQQAQRQHRSRGMREGSDTESDNVSDSRSFSGDSSGSRNAAGKPNTAAAAQREQDGDADSEKKRHRHRHRHSRHNSSGEE